MNTGILTSAFILGTFKFMFAHWATHTAAITTLGEEIPIWQIFISVTAGAWLAMTIFYFSSEFFMIRAHNKRKAAIQLAKETGTPLKRKRNFTWINKFIVRIKVKLGIYGVTAIAPLVLSIPIGSIVCAKFFGKERRTFYLMLLSTGTYSALQCSLIYILA